MLLFIVADTCRHGSLLRIPRGGVALQLGPSRASPVRVRVPQAQPPCCALSTLSLVMMLRLLQMAKASGTLSCKRSCINTDVLRWGEGEGRR